jgi:hypothetical protein
MSLNYTTCIGGQYCTVSEGSTPVDQTPTSPEKTEPSNVIRGASSRLQELWSDIRNFMDGNNGTFLYDFLLIIIELSLAVAIGIAIGRHI